MMSSSHSIKAEAHWIVEQLSDDATWDDLIYHISVRQSIEAGLKDAKEGRVQPLDVVIRDIEAELRARYSQALNG